MSYLCMKVLKQGWIRCLKVRYSDLDFIKKATVRTAVGTPRNQGLISLLLSVKGSCPIQLIKNRVKECILEKRKGKKLVFPHLRSKLTTKWGNYAWIKGTDAEFSLNKHILLAPTTFKGRRISHLNIQDMASDMISKGLPAGIPPWRISVITAVDKCYLLIRVHHLYMSEDGLTLSDIFRIQQTSCESNHVLDGVFRPPILIPRVYAALSESTSNVWNEKTEVLNSLIISSIFKLLSLNALFGMILMFIKLPWAAIKMPMKAFKLFSNLPIYLYWLCLGNYVAQEFIYLFKLFYRAPRILFEELFLPQAAANIHKIQTLSICGRKVVSWSESVPKDVIKQIAYATGSTEREIMLTALAASLRNSFEQAEFPVPESIMTTCHFTRKGEVPGSGSRGFLCLPLPVRSTNLIDSLEAMKKSLYESKKSQTVFYLASERGLDSRLLIGLLPMLFAKAALYLLSRRYAVSVSLVEGAPDCTLIWDQHVEELMYWRPGQANVSLSITVICYGDSVTLGVLADAQLSPHHADLSIYFPKFLRNLASLHGIAFPEPST